MKSGIPAADIAAGMYTFSGVLAALVRRGANGRGGRAGAAVGAERPGVAAARRTGAGAAGVGGPGPVAGSGFTGGAVAALLPPITLPGGDEARMGDVPALGEHTEALLRAVGMTDEEIAALRRDGVVA